MLGRDSPLVGCEAMVSEGTIERTMHALEWCQPKWKKHAYGGTYYSKCTHSDKNFPVTLPECVCPHDKHRYCSLFDHIFCYARISSSYLQQGQCTGSTPLKDNVKKCFVQMSRQLTICYHSKATTLCRTLGKAINPAMRTVALHNSFLRVGHGTLKGRRTIGSINHIEKKKQVGNILGIAIAIARKGR